MANSAVVGLLRVILTANATEFEAAMGKASSAAAKWSKDVKKMGEEATRVGAALTKTFTLPLVAIGAGAAKLAIDFESAFAGVRKTVDATEPEFAAMAQAFRDLAKQIPVPVEELARLGETAGALGIAKENVVDFSRVMALLGVTTNVSSEQAAESIAQIQTQFKAAGKETQNFASALVYLGNHGASTEKQILELAARLASAGNAAGMSQADVLGFAAAMANVGIEAEAGGTALSRTFNEINLAVARGGTELEGFAKVAGLSVDAFAEKFKTDAAGAVKLFIDGLGKIHEEGGSLVGMLDELGIKEIRQADTLRRLALNTKNVSDALRDSHKGWTDNSALMEEARKRFETTESRMKLLWQRIKDVGIELGNALRPSIDLAIDAFDKLIPLLDGAVKAFGSLPTPVQAVATGFIAVFAAAGPLIWGFGQLATNASAMVNAFKAGGILAEMAKGLNAVYVAALAAAPQLAAFAIASASVIAIGAALRNTWGLYTDSIEQAKIATSQAVSFQQSLAAASKLAGRQITDLAEAHRILKENAAAQVAEQDRLAAAAAAAGKALQQSTPDTLIAKFKAVRDEVARYTAEQIKEVDAGKKMGMTAEKIAEHLNKMFPGLKATEAGVDLLTDRLKDNAAAGKKSGDAFKALLEDIRKFGQEASTVDISKIGTFSDLAGPVAMEMQSLIDRTAALSAEQRRTIDTSLELGRSTKQIAEDMKLGADVVDRYADNMKALWKANEELGSKSAGATAWVTKWETQAGTMQELLAATKHEVANLSAEQLKNIEAGLAMGMSLEEVAKAAGVSVEALKLLKSGTGSLSDSFKGALKDLPKVIMGAVQGGGNIGKAVGGLFGASLFGPDSGLTKSLGSLASKGIGKVLGPALGKSIGGALGSVIPGLGTIVGTMLGGVAGKFLGKLFGGGEQKKVREMRDKFIEAAGGIEVLNAQALKAGVTLDKVMSAKTVKEYEAAIGNLKGAFDQLAKNQEKATGIFGAIMEAGSHGIPAAYRPAIEQLIELGLLTDEQAEKLRALGDGAVLDVDKMRGAMETLGGRIESLGPAFRQAEIDKTAGQYVNAIDTLIQGGGDVGGVLFDAKEELSKLVNDSLKFGTTLPANMKPWIEELQRAGLLLDENGNKITDTSDLKYGEAMKTEAEIAEEGWRNILDAIRDLIGEIRGPLAGAINSIPTERRVRITYEEDGRPSEGGGEQPGYASGTMGRTGSFWSNFRSGTDTRLHGWEAVVTPPQALPFSLATLEPLLTRLAPDAGGNTTSNTSTNNVALVMAPGGGGLDPNRIANEVFRQWPSAMQSDRHGMLSAIEQAIEDYQRTYGNG